MKKYLQGSLLVITVISFLISSTFVVFGAVNPTGSNYTNNSTNKEFSTVGKSNADSVLQKDKQGNYTEASIRAYQAATPGLKVDGMIGKETAAALNKASATSTKTPVNTSTDKANLTPEETEKALQDASDLAKDTRTDAERDAADQEALKNATKPKPSTATDNILGLEEGKLKAGDVDMNTIPIVIVNLISTLLAIAGTVAIFSLIYHAVKMQINSGITGDSSGVDSAKKGMIGALIGFVIAISAWFLVTQAVSLLGSVT